MTNLCRRTLLTSLIVASFLAFMGSWVLRVGIELTPYSTTDSAGRTMGFKDRFSSEHYQILLRNFRVRALFQLEYLYEWLLLAMHVAGVALLWSPRHQGRPHTRWFFAAQAALFPFAGLGVVLLPWIIHEMATLSLDREGFVDIPFIWCTAHPIWVGVALAIAFAMPGQGWGVGSLFRRMADKFEHFARALRSRAD